MKKRVFVIGSLILLIVLINVNLFAEPSGKNSDEKTAKENSRSVVTRTYVLKYVSPKVVQRTLSSYLLNATYDSNGTMLSVVLYAENVAEFEKYLKQLDVPKKSVLVRIFTVVASHQGKEGITGNENAELKQVLTELQKVMRFKSFAVDGVSAITVADQQERGELILSSQFPLRFIMARIKIKEDTQSKAEIGFEFRLEQRVFVEKDKWQYESLIESETSILEKGYLVAGVSKIGANGDSLVLVINAEVKK